MNESEKRILDERARLQARKKDTATDDSEKLAVVTFVLHPECYALEYGFVKEVFTMKDLTPLPGTPPFVMGIVNYRGTVVSAINLKQLFGLKEMGLTEFNKLLILSEGKMTIGIMADTIKGHQFINKNSLSSPPMTVSENSSAFLKGVTPEGIILLDAAGILQSPGILVDH